MYYITFKRFKSINNLDIRVNNNLKEYSLRKKRPGVKYSLVE